MRFAHDLANVGRGLLMGAADIVPGVSGGTVALVLGIYQRLIEAVSRFDKELVVMVSQRRWSDAARRVDLRFLVALAVGILAGVVGLARLMHFLLEHHRSFTYAAFFGLILASGILVGRMTRAPNRGAAVKCVVAGVIAAYFAYWLVAQHRIVPPSGLGYVFMCGAVAICAMILPGISGAYILLLLGKYEDITGILKRAPHGDVTPYDMVTLSVFAAGCALGLLAFSKLLRLLLANYWSTTMATLCGFMIGSLYMVWPYQVDLTPHVQELKRKEFAPVWPDTIDADTLGCALIAAACLVAVLSLDHLARKPNSGPTRAIPE